ncbi:ATP-dependent zinc metalloprotease FTSH 2, chloroplastic [Apostasia shenzhenica]|uniref:ATP-dependent zinc metalloprotease FTSH 2, chloroplastic n=1 Tax=Apostasia shenzhenica TaxID=1088818 RepID=A0A2I0ADN1_9ASPA|nr:ATP-dependent zinc metalloprotease FTSH 2, chloroplastic [Apostasia shenzhenica]
MDSRSRAVSSTKRWLTAIAPVAASATLAGPVIIELLPNELRSRVSSGIDRLFFSPIFAADHTIVIRQTDSLNSNLLYDASITYLSVSISPSMNRLRASKHADDNAIVLLLDENEEHVDIFAGAGFRWKLFRDQNNQSQRHSGELRWLELTFHRKHMGIALESYFSHILERSKEIKSADRRLKIHLNEYDDWIASDLQHPATFATVAMEPELKRTIMKDLERFVKRKEYYSRIGKAWKRGYLIYGPPGTGKSSLIAAMANYLKFDIYDMELKEVWYNSRLKALMKSMKSKSILVIEDIDGAIRIQNRGEKAAENRASDDYDEITLSALLNAIDGLCSVKGEERIIVFTTNYKEKLDPALLRPGRMDVHIYMGYCTPSSFRVLASNYLAIDEHPLLEEIEELLTEVGATPAEVAEELMRSEDVDIALMGLIQLLNRKKKESPEAEGCVGDARIDDELVVEDERQKGSEIRLAAGEERQ